MQIKISDVKINPGRRDTQQRNVEELARSIAAVGLLNPITLDQNNTLVAGLHRLEAAKLLGWTEIECTAIGMNTVQAELAEIDENIVRTRLNRQELCEQLLRRKEIYEMLHPETKAGAAQAAGMNRAIGNNVSAKLAPTSKSFVEDTSEKTGIMNASYKSKKFLLYVSLHILTFLFNGCYGVFYNIFQSKRIFANNSPILKNFCGSNVIKKTVITSLV